PRSEDPAEYPQKRKESRTAKKPQQQVAQLRRGPGSDRYSRRPPTTERSARHSAAAVIRDIRRPAPPPSLHSRQPQKLPFSTTVHETPSPASVLPGRQPGSRRLSPLQTYVTAPASHRKRRTPRHVPRWTPLPPPGAHPRPRRPASPPMGKGRAAPACPQS